MRHSAPAFSALALLTLTGVSLLYAQAQAPVIRANSVVNAASQIPPGLPNYGIAQGSMFTLRGQGLASGTPPVFVANYPLPLTLAGASMQITVAGAKVDVLMVYATPGQLAGIVPSTTPTGDGTITVAFSGRTSAPAPITIAPRAFGIFTLNQSGAGPGVFTRPDLAVNTLMAQRLIGPFFPDATYGGNSLIAAAHPGDPLVIWGTGLGPIAGDDAATPPADALDAPVEVYVGGVKAEVASQGRASCCSGVDQVQFTVPPGVQGCYVPVAVRIGATVSNFATISISPDGGVCSDPLGWSASDLQTAPNGVPTSVADVGVARAIVNFSIAGLGTAQGPLDFGNARFKHYTGQPLGALASIAGPNGNLAVPSSGCLVFPFESLGPLFDNFLPGTNALPLGGDAPYQYLDAGPALNITGPAGARSLPRNTQQNAGDEYKVPGSIVGGGAPPLLPPTPEFLVPGSYSVDNGSGGADVKPFSAALTVPSNPASWTGQDAISTIPRSQDLTITWNGSGMVVILGNSANTAARVGAQFVCVAGDANNGTFTVPAWVLPALPASGLGSDIPAPVAYLGVAATLPAPTRFQAPGIDVGYFNWFVIQLKNVNFQ